MIDSIQCQVRHVSMLYHTVYVFHHDLEEKSKDAGLFLSSQKAFLFKVMTNPLSILVYAPLKFFLNIEI